jgi:hypothetical protein
MGATNKLKEALAGPAKDKREPAVADGVLSVTPDPPEAAEWRNKSVLNTVAADSTLLEEESGDCTCCAAVLLPFATATPSS